MHTVNSYKEVEMSRCRRLRCLGRALRCLEACAALIIALSWSSTRLPCAARASGEAIRATTALLLSPGFVFLLGNAIVILLFTKFRLHLVPSDDRSYNEFLEARDVAPYFPPPPAEVVYEDKEVCVESRRALGRSRSAGGGRRRRAPAPELLRRTESEVLVERKDVAVEQEEEVVDAAAAGEDAEEFRRTVEEFIIKKHRMFQREEENNIVSSAGPPQHEIIQYYN